MSQPTQSPPHRKARPHRHSRVREWCRACASRRTAFRVCRCCVRLAALLVLLGAGLLAYLQYVGLPDWAKDRWVAALEKRGIYLAVDRITFGPLEGVVAHGFHFFDSPHRALPMLEAEHVQLQLDLSAWLRRRAAWTGLRVRQGIARISTQGTLVRAQPNQILEIRLEHGDLRFHGDRVEVHELRAGVLGVRIDGQGWILLGAAAGVSPGPVLTESLGGEDDPPWSLAPAPEWLSTWIQRLNEIEIRPTPELSAAFVIDTRDLPASGVRFAGSGRRTAVHGVRLEAWDFDASYTNRLLTVASLRMETSSGTVELEGTYDADQGVVSARVAPSVVPTHWLSLAPSTWRDRVDAARLFFNGPIRIHEMTVGPAPAAALWTELAGRADVERAELRDVWIERIGFRFTNSTDRLELTEIDAVVGQEPHQGALAGRLAFDWTGRAYKGHLESDMDFVAFIPVLGEHWVRLIRSTRFPEKPPHVVADIRGRFDDPEAFVMQGTFEGEDFLYRETYVNHLVTDILSSNRVLTLDSLYGVRDEGDVDGLIRLDFRERRIDLDLHTRADPKAMGRVASERMERILRPFTFDGPTEAQVAGSIHIGTNGVTGVRASTEAQMLGLRSFVADRASFDLAWTGRHVVVTNIHAEIYGGALTGVFEVRPDEESDRPRYDLDMRASGVRFLDVVRTLAHREGEEYRGDIDGRLRLTGILGPDAGRTAIGSGEIRIRDGRIMMIPLFGPLSKGLSRIFPGLGFTRQTDLAATFDVEDLHLRAETVGLRGNMFSLDAVGDYSIEDKGLDFDAEFLLLGDGLVGDVVQFVTSPISKLLEFDLEGTLEAPEWRPKNLPRELFAESD